jgi:hypothetical protein
MSKGTTNTDNRRFLGRAGSGGGGKASTGGAKGQVMVTTGLLDSTAGDQASFNDKAGFVGAALGLLPETPGGGGVYPATATTDTGGSGPDMMKIALIGAVGIGLYLAFA